MAHIIDLPEEVLIMILRRLDFCSLNNMYNTCKFFKDLLCMPNVVLVCNMSTNLMATANTLKLDFFRDISKHLRVLNMRGVHDLSKTKALKIFKKLKHLKVLDISYTDLTIPDLVDLHNACPTMTDITIDFKFGNLPVEVSQQHNMCHWQALFAHYKNVHFVGTIDNLLCSSLVLHILKDSKLETLQFSIVELENLHNTIITETQHVGCLMPYFDHFAAYLMVKNWRSRRTNRIDETIYHFPVISTMQLQNYEYCVIYSYQYTRHISSVYATPLFKKFFSDHFNVNIKTTEEHAREGKSNLAFLVWNRETTQFDDIFFQKLFIDVKPYFPFFYECYSDVTCPKSYDWILINPSQSDVKINDDNDDAIQVKKRKTSMPKVELDLDNLLKDKTGQVQLSIIFSPELIGSVSLPRFGQYFSKITFIYFHGAIKYTSDFFLNLFQRCHNLETLSIELPALTSGRYALDILHSLQASKSLKNLRLVVKGMDFKLYFVLLSKCKILENILLIDPKQWDHCNIADPTELIESCTNLYSVCIEAPFAVSAQVKLFQLFNTVKKRCKRPHLKVVINCVSSKTPLYGYDPYMEVFKLNSIKPIKKRILYY